MMVFPLASLCCSSERGLGNYNDFSLLFLSLLDLMEGYREIADMKESELMTECKAIADMKFTYVVSCQQYGIQKRSGDPCAHDILRTGMVIMMLVVESQSSDDSGCEVNDYWSLKFSSQEFDHMYAHICEIFALHTLRTHVI